MTLAPHLSGRNQVYEQPAGPQDPGDITHWKTKILDMLKDLIAHDDVELVIREGYNAVIKLEYARAEQTVRCHLRTCIASLIEQIDPLAVHAGSICQLHKLARAATVVEDIRRICPMVPPRERDDVFVNEHHGRLLSSRVGAACADPSTP